MTLRDNEKRERIFRCFVICNTWDSFLHWGIFLASVKNSNSNWLKKRNICSLVIEKSIPGYIASGMAGSRVQTMSSGYGLYSLWLQRVYSHLVISSHLPTFLQCSVYAICVADHSSRNSIYFQVVTIKSWDYAPLANSGSYTSPYALVWGQRMWESSISKGKSRFCYQKKSYSDGLVKKVHVHYRYLSKRLQLRFILLFNFFNTRQVLLLKMTSYWHEQQSSWNVLST